MGRFDSCWWRFYYLRWQEINLDRKIVVFGIKFALIALAINMILFVVPMILDLMQKSVWKIIAMKGFIIYGFLMACFFIYLAVKIKAPK